jgi:hypothetical protein
MRAPLREIHSDELHITLVLASLSSLGYVCCTSQLQYILRRSYLLRDVNTLYCIYGKHCILLE